MCTIRSSSFVAFSKYHIPNMAIEKRLQGESCNPSTKPCRSTAVKIATRKLSVADSCAQAKFFPFRTSSYRLHKMNIFIVLYPEHKFVVEMRLCCGALTELLKEYKNKTPTSYNYTKRESKRRPDTPHEVQQHTRSHHQHH